MEATEAKSQKAKKPQKPKAKKPQKPKAKKPQKPQKPKAKKPQKPQKPQKPKAKKPKAKKPRSQEARNPGKQKKFPQKKKKTPKLNTPPKKHGYLLTLCGGGVDWSGAAIEVKPHTMLGKSWQTVEQLQNVWNLLATSHCERLFGAASAKTSRILMLWLKIPAPFHSQVAKQNHTSEMCVDLSLSSIFLWVASHIAAGKCRSESTNLDLCNQHTAGSIFRKWIPQHLDPGIFRNSKLSVTGAWRMSSARHRAFGSVSKSSTSDPEECQFGKYDCVAIITISCTSVIATGIPVGNMNAGATQWCHPSCGEGRLWILVACWRGCSGVIVLLRQVDNAIGIKDCNKSN